MESDISNNSLDPPLNSILIEETTTTLTLLNRLTTLSISKLSEIDFINNNNNNNNTTSSINNASIYPSPTTTTPTFTNQSHTSLNESEISFVEEWAKNVELVSQQQQEIDQTTPDLLLPSHDFRDELDGGRERDMRGIDIGSMEIPPFVPKDKIEDSTRVGDRSSVQDEFTSLASTSILPPLQSESVELESKNSPSLASQILISSNIFTFEDSASFTATTANSKQKGLVGSPQTSLLPAFAEFIQESFGLGPSSRELGNDEAGLGGEGVLLLDFNESLRPSSSIWDVNLCTSTALSFDESPLSVNTTTTMIPPDNLEIQVQTTPRNSIDFESQLLELQTSPAFKRLSKIQNDSLALEREPNIEDFEDEDEDDEQEERDKDLASGIEGLETGEEYLSISRDFEDHESSNVGYTQEQVEVSEEEEEEEEEESEEEEEDTDSHPLYVLLSTATIPSLKQTWNTSTLILVPPRRTVPSLTSLVPLLECLTPRDPNVSKGFQVVRGAKGVSGELAGRDRDKERQEEREKGERLENYVKLHAFRKEDSSEADSWRSVGGDDENGFVRVRLETSRGLAHVEWVIKEAAVEDAGALRNTPSQSQSNSTSNSNSASPSIQNRFSHLSASTSTSATTNSTTSSSFNLPELTPSSFTIPISRLSRSEDLVRDSFDSDTSDLLPSTPPTPTSNISHEDHSSSNTKPRRLTISTSSNPILPPIYSPTSTTSTTRALQIVSETTIYRRPYRPPPIAGTPSPTTSPSPIKSQKPAFRAPKWLRRGSNNTNNSNLPPLKLESTASKIPMLERVRVIALDGEIVLSSQFGMRSDSTRNNIRSNNNNGKEKEKDKLVLRINTTGRFNRVASQASLLNSAGGERNLRRVGSMASTRSNKSNGAWNTAGGNGVGESRDFIDDLTFLATPPPSLSAFAPLFLSTLIMIRSLVKDFETNFVYVKGFDSYIVQRIQTGILETSWSQLKERLDNMPSHSGQIIAEERNRLSQLLENIVIGLLYAKIYKAAIVPLYINENSAINHILSLYRARGTSPADLGVDICDFGRGDSLRAAVAAMSRLGRYGVTIGSIPPELLQILSNDGSEADVLSTLAEARTPLGCISAMRLAIEEIVASVESVRPGSRVAPDDLIPLLAWVTIQSGATDLESLLYFVKTFRLGNTLAAELDFSFVTFQAALAFLLSDPLDSLSSSPLPNIPPPQSSSRPSSPPPLRASDLPSFRSRRSSLQTNYNGPPIKTRPIGRNLGLSVSTSAVSPVREKMVNNWQSGRLRKNSSLSSERSNANEMLPPSRNIQRRGSIGSLPLRSSPAGFEETIPESPITPSSARPLSIASSSSASELQIRPQIIIPYRSAHHRSTHHSSYSDSRSDTSSRSPSRLSDRQIGPSISAEMTRSGSEGSSSSRPLNLRGQSEPWSLWKSRTEQPSLSPSLSASTSTEDSSWWGWAKSEESHETSTSSCRDVDGALTSRRYSSADILGGRTFSLPNDQTTTSTRLSTIVASRKLAPISVPRPRPRSMMSFHSDSSTASSPTTSTPTFSRRTTHNSMLSTSATLAPKLDSSHVSVSFETSLYFPRTNSISSLSKFT